MVRFKTVVAPLDTVIGVKSRAYGPGFATTRWRVSVLREGD